MAKVTKSRRLGWAVLALSLLLTGLLAGGATLLLYPHLRRAQMLAKLTDPDLAQRQRAAQYVARHIDRDPRILPAVITRLSTPDQANFIHLVQLLDSLGRWRRPHIPLDPWLRWIALLGQDKDPESRILAAQAVADLHADSGDPRLPDLLRPWLQDQQEKVRFNALVATAELAGAAAERRAYEDLLAAATTDAQPQIAREAWLLLGLLDPHSGVAGNWRTADPPVAAAMLWAAVRSDPQHPQPALEALGDASLPMGLRAAAVYALGYARAPAAREALLHLLAIDPAQVNDENQLLIWRAMVALARMGGEVEPAAERWLDPAAVRSASTQAAPIVFAAAHAFPHRLAQQFDLEDLGGAPLTLLAALEGWPPGRPSPSLLLARESPPLLRLAALAVQQVVTAEDLRDLLEDRSPALRDVAAVVALERLTPAELDKLIETLIVSFDDRGKMSGSILSGLTARQGELLRKRAAKEDVWSVRSVQHVGLWAQGLAPLHETIGQEQVAGMLTRDDLPTTTLLLALLHRQRTLALDYLLTPRADERTFRGPTIDPDAAPDSEASLLTLLDDYRWQRVLQRYLPADAPRIHHWADPDAKQFELDLLRNWYLLNRGRANWN